MANRTFTFHRNHPKNRATYTIPGTTGVFVVPRHLFVGAIPENELADIYDLGGLPKEITIDTDLVEPTVKAPKIEKAEVDAAKAIEKMNKAMAAAEKAAEILAKAKARVEAAQAAAPADVAVDVVTE